MRRLKTWLLAGAVLLCASTAQAGLQLRLKTEGLSPAEQQASQALLDEALRSLPPRFVEQLDRRIDVGWTDKMPENAYGQASLVSELDLNQNLLASLTDGTLFVVREDFTKREEALNAIGQLKKSEKVKLIGTVMNYCETETSEYYYSYYTKDGKKVKKGSDDQGTSKKGIFTNRANV